MRPRMANNVSRIITIMRITPRRASEGGRCGRNMIDSLLNTYDGLDSRQRRKRYFRTAQYIFKVSLVSHILNNRDLPSTLCLRVPDSNCYLERCNVQLVDFRTRRV